MNRRFAAVPVLAAAAISLAACGTGGIPTPAQGGGSTPTIGASTTSGGGSTGSGGSALAALQPCSLISAAELSTLQMTQSSSGTGSGARSCSWTKPVDQNGLNGYTAGVDIRDSQGLAGANTTGYTVTSDPVGSHQGKQLQSTNSGDCIVVIGVSSSSRVDVSVNAGTDANQACQVANQLAKVVEPQLPAGS